MSQQSLDDDQSDQGMSRAILRLHAAVVCATALTAKSSDLTELTRACLSYSSATDIIRESGVVTLLLQSLDLTSDNEIIIARLQLMIVLFWGITGGKDGCNWLV